MKTLAPLCLFVLSFTHLLSQPAKNRVISVPVIRNGLTARDAWAGGMDSPQFSSCDLNNDGIKDLFVFDRVSNKVMTYLGNGSQTDTMFTYAPQYESVFPAMAYWALLRDYNGDGVDDLFTYGASSAGPGIKVYKGHYNQGVLRFDLVCPIINYTDASFTVLLFVNTGDIPVITDVNHDGDLDIMAYNRNGLTISYYENQTVENAGNPDSFKYNLVTPCWGNIVQDLTSNSIRLNQSCKGGYGTTGADDGDIEQRHSGNSIYSITNPTTGAVDLLNGNIGYNTLLLMHNCGDSSYANICAWDSVYPLCDYPFAMPTYPAAYGVSLNGNASDILLAPNTGAVFTGTGGGSNVKNVGYYKNTGDTACQYHFIEDSFLVHHQLDFGTNSRALFYDVDGDGLTDLLASSAGYYQENQNYKSQLAYYKNTGTATNPVFTQVTINFANMDIYNLSDINPAIGDLDGDGHADMLIGTSSGDFYYLKNTATTGLSFPAITSAQYFGLHTAISAAPVLYDVNGDSLNDLIVGTKNGKLSYYWNFGTRTNAMFSSDSVNTNFGGVDVSNGLSLGYSTPYIIKSSSGQLQLFVGSYNGKIYEYEIDPAHLRSGSFNLITDNFLGRYTGNNSSISMADINNDGDMEYIVGNASGGLQLYSDSVWDSSTAPLTVKNVESVKERSISIYPNPAKNYVICQPVNFKFTQPLIELYNLIGERLNAEVSISADKATLNTQNLSGGVYLLQISDKDCRLIKKLVITQ